MENLDQYLGVYDENTKTITLRTESKGLRYEERTPRLDYRSVGDPVQLVREPTNSFNSNNIMILSDSGESLGNLSADLCNVISPLLDLGYLTIHDAHITYIERIRERSRYARQGVLFIQFQVQLHGIWFNRERHRTISSKRAAQIISCAALLFPHRFHYVKTHSSSLELRRTATNYYNEVLSRLECM